jgi:SAM-dependent methyltransferase
MMGLLSNHLADTRTKKIMPYVKGAVLDLGCGRLAPVTQRCAASIESYYGVERDPDFVENLKKKFPEHSFFAMDLDDDSFDFDIDFDTILLIAVIEHVFNQKHLACQLVKKLKAGGRLIVTTPTPLGDWIHRVGSKFGLFAKSADDHHIVIYNKRRFQVLAKCAGLRIEKYKTFQFGCNQLVILTRDDSSGCS